MTNYWLLLLWVLIVGGILNISTPRETVTICGRRRQVWPKLSALVLVIPYCYWGGFRKDFGDTEMYRLTFNNMATGLSGLSEYYKNLSKDKFFYSLEYIIKSVISDKPEVFFLIIATIEVVLIALMFRKFSSDYWLAIFIFIASTDYLSWVFNGARQFLAVAMIYAATPLLLKKKYIPLILIILLASRFHGSALLMLPIVFIIQGKAFNKTTLLCILASIIAVAYVGRFTNILDDLLAETQYTNVVSDWKAINDDGMNPIRALVYSVPTILAIIGYKSIKIEDDPVINMAANASLVTTALTILAVGTSGIYIGRLPIYTSLYANGIMLPWAIDHIFVGSSARFIKKVTIAFFIVFFYYQTHFTWGIL